MDIPEKVAKTGIENVELYIKLNDRITELESQFTKLKEKLNSIEKEIVIILKTQKISLWRLESYRIGKERPHLNSLKLCELSKMCLDITFRITDLENEKLQLESELYEKNWLPDWQQREMKRILSEE